MLCLLHGKRSMLQQDDACEVFHVRCFMYLGPGACLNKSAQQNQYIFYLSAHTQSFAGNRVSKKSLAEVLDQHASLVHHLQVAFQVRFAKEYMCHVELQLVEAVTKDMPSAALATTCVIVQARERSIVRCRLLSETSWQ